MVRHNCEMLELDPVTLAVDLNPGFALARLESPTHAITVGEAADGRHRVELASAVVAASRDFELAWTPDVGSAPGAALFTEVRDGGVYALLMVNPPPLVAIPPRSMATAAAFPHLATARSDFLLRRRSRTWDIPPIRPGRVFGRRHPPG